MKKIILIIAVVMATCGYSFGQELGVRFGYGVGNGNAAIDGVFGAGKFSRIHADVGFGGGVGIDVLWDFLYKPIGGEALYWYIGAGPYTLIGDNFHLGVAGEIGLEYRFNKTPIVIGADYRPKLRIIDKTEFVSDVVALNIRYVFGKK